MTSNPWQMALVVRDVHTCISQTQIRIQITEHDRCVLMLMTHFIYSVRHLLCIKIHMSFNGCLIQN